MKQLNVPVHSLGISQIVSFGLLFYAFAQLKTPLAHNAGVSETTILAVVSGALVIQGLLAQVIGRWIDHFGGLRIMQGGFLIGAFGIGLLCNAAGVDDHRVWGVVDANPRVPGFAQISSYGGRL